MPMLIAAASVLAGPILKFPSPLPAYAADVPPPSMLRMASELSGQRRVRSLSTADAAVIAIFIQAYAEGHFSAIKLSTGLCLASLLIGEPARDLRKLLLRFHLIPILQGYAVARLCRFCARFLYSNVLEEQMEQLLVFGRGGPQRQRARPQGLYGRVRGSALSGRGVSRLAARIGAVPVRMALKPITSQWRMAAGAHAHFTGRSRGAAAAPPELEATSVLTNSSTSSESATNTAATNTAATNTSATTSAAITSAATTTSALRLSARPPAGKAVLQQEAAAYRSAGLTRPKKRVLILISDTGGGHRASAQALAEAFRERHADSIETSIVDVWTLYGPWPWGKRLVPYYRALAKRPFLWWAHFKATTYRPAAYVMCRLMSTICYQGFESCIKEHSPDVVVSMHPLCQEVPIKVLQSMQQKDLHGAADSTSTRFPRRIPFVTVVTDLATPHPFWLHSKSDLCFVPSSEFARAARVRGLRQAQLRLHGLPVRPAFASQGRSLRDNSADHPRKKAALSESLGLLPGRKTVLVVGGGDGVGNLGAIVEAMGEKMAAHNAAGAGASGAPLQLVVICGKNHRLRQRLRERDWGPHLNVVIEGFVTRMSDYMASVDCIVTKAGPGTIAEACCCGLPIMLSGHLPGQETGNIDFVVNGGFGAYSSEPKVIASTVCSWLEDDAMLSEMSARSMGASRPAATGNIADDIAHLISREHHGKVGASTQEVLADAGLLSRRLLKRRRERQAERQRRRAARQEARLRRREARRRASAEVECPLTPVEAGAALA